MNWRNNNRKTLVEILAQHTGKSNKDILSDPNAINLKDVLTLCWSGCEVDKEDLKTFKAWSSLQMSLTKGDLYQTKIANFLQIFCNKK